MTGGTYDTHSSFDFRHISYFLIHIWAADWTSTSSITFQKRSGYRLPAILPLIKKTTLFTLLATPAFSTSSLPLNLFRHCVSWFRKTCACFQDFLIRQKKKRPPVVLLMQEDTINKYNFVLKINEGGGKEKKKDARNKMSRTPKLIFTRFVSLKHIITNTENKELNSLHVV